MSGNSREVAQTVLLAVAVGVTIRWPAHWIGPALAVGSIVWNLVEYRRRR